MKRLFISTISIVLLFLTTFIGACDGPEADAPNPQTQIQKTWQLGSTGLIKQDGVIVTSEYPGLTITFSDNGTYTTTNGKKLFYPSGTWNWSGTGITEMVMDGDLPVTVSLVNATALSFSFHMDVDHVNSNGRTSATVGDYEILLNGN